MRTGPRRPPATPGETEWSDTMTKPEPAAKAATKKPLRATRPDGKRKGARHDWEAIERDFRTGKFSVRELEAKHGAGYSDISKRAKRDGWTKDLAAAVRQATSAALIQEITTQATTGAQQTTTDVVLAAAEVHKQVVLGHRSDLGRLKQQAARLLDELVMTKDHESTLEEAADVLGKNSDDPKADNKLRAALDRAMSLPSRVKAFKDVTDAVDKIHSGERRAFGLDEKEPPPPPGGGSIAGRVVDLADDDLLVIARGTNVADAAASSR